MSDNNSRPSDSRDRQYVIELPNFEPSEFLMFEEWPDEDAAYNASVEPVQNPVYQANEVVLGESGSGSGSHMEEGSDSSKQNY